MIKKIQTRFILVTALSLILVLGFVATAINLVAATRFTYEADQKLSGLQLKDGNILSFDAISGTKQDMPWDFKTTRETPFEMRYFFVRLNTDGEVIAVNLDHIAAVGSEEAKMFAVKVSENTQTSGYQGQYRYLISNSEDGGQLIIFLDCSSILQTQRMLLFISVVIGAVSVMLILLLVMFLSTRLLRPLILNEKKQHQFIADASHELKTPLSIISANTDLVEFQSGKSEWTESTRNQVVRMDNLIRQLLNLAKSEEQAQTEFPVISISEITSQMISEFKPLAEAKEKSLYSSIEPDLKIKGDPQQFRQLLSILLDNSILHSSDQANIQLSLRPHAKELHLSVSNESAPLPETSLSRLFDRFYRPDSSRARSSGGYGLGLSIASSIVKSFRGQITARYSKGRITFEISIPCV